MDNLQVCFYICFCLNKKSKFNFSLKGELVIEDIWPEYVNNIFVC